jgi:hypothetical protein
MFEVDTFFSVERYDLVNWQTTRADEDSEILNVPQTGETLLAFDGDRCRVPCHVRDVELTSARYNFLAHFLFLS